MKILSPLIIAGLLIINLYYCNFAFAINVSEAINLAIANNIEIQIERKKTDYSTFLQYETITDFLPNASLNYRDGTRTTAINSIHNKQKDRVTTLNISQPLFSGFSGLAKYRQSVYQNKSAKENLKLKQNEIALRVAESYFSIAKYQQLVKLDTNLRDYYRQAVTLTKKKLELQDLNYEEFSVIELNAKKSDIEFNQHKIALIGASATFNSLTNLQNIDSEDLEFPDLQELKDFSETQDLASFVATAIRENPRIKSASFISKAKENATLSEGAKILPKISLNYQEETQKSSYYFDNQNLNNKSIYLNFAVPIFQSGEEYSGIIKANKESQIANLEKKLPISEISRDALENYQKFLYLQKNLQLSVEALATSTKALDIAKRKFNKKDLALTDYLLQQINNIELEKQLIITKCDYLISYYNLKFLTNEINSRQ